MRTIIYLSLLMVAATRVFSEPFSIATIEKSTSKNFSLELSRVEQAYERLGIEIEWIYLPGVRSIQMTNDGEFDAEGARILDAIVAQPKLVVVEEPVGYHEIFVYAPSSLKDFSPAMLAGATVSGIRGTVLNQWLEATFKVKFVDTPSLESSLAMLQYSRVDFVIYSSKVVDPLLEDLGLDGQIVRVGESLTEIPLYHSLNAQHHNLVPKLEAALRDVKAAE